MIFRYSPSTNTFYPDDIDYGANLPDVLIDVDEANYHKAMSRLEGEEFKVAASGKVTISNIIVALDELKARRKQQIKDEANALVDVHIGASPRDQLKMVASGLNMLDAQVGRGGSPARNPALDNLVAIFDYVEAVAVAEQDAFDAVDLSNDPSTVLLIHPPLPSV